MLYRAIFTADSDKRFCKSGHHTINIILHFMHYHYISFKPDRIHIFWDADRDKIWRKKYAPNYKENRKNNSRLQDISSRLTNIATLCIILFDLIGFRQYYRTSMEADDLIYAFCRVNRDKKIVIVSSDGDLKQISYNFPNISIHNPQSKSKNKIEPVPEIDPVIYKCFVGDKSDNIEGYYGIGDVRARVLCESIANMIKFFDSPKAIAKVEGEKAIIGEQRFRDNMRIIDLNLCPELLENALYIARRQVTEIKFDLKSVRKLIVKRKLRGVAADMDRYIVPFKKLVEDNHGSVDQGSTS